MILLIIILIIVYVLSIEKFENSEIDYILPKNIYAYWNNYESDLLIQAFVINWRKHIPNDWTINIISDNNLSNYVDNIFIQKYNMLPSYRFSDFLRLELLKKNGGCWIDISTILLNGMVLNNYRDEMIINKYDVLLFEFKVKTIDIKFPYLENWFIMAPKNSKYIGDLYTEFNKAYNMEFIKYVDNVLIPNNINLNNTIGYNGETYLMQHAIAHYLLSINKYKINIKLAEDSMFMIQQMFNWDSDKIINYIMTCNEWNGILGIKFVSKVRDAIIDTNQFIDRLHNI